MLYCKKENIFSVIKYNIVEWFRRYKVLIIISLIILAIGILTGIFTAIKLNNLDTEIELSDYSMYAILDNSIYNFSYIFIRLISVLIFMALLFLCSLNKFLIPIGLFILAYRAYLLSLNCVIITLNVGFAGVFFSLIIIVPCQLLILFFLIFFYCVVMDIMLERKKYGCCDKSKKNLIWIFLLAFLLLSLLESLLLFIFKPTSLFII